MFEEVVLNSDKMWVIYDRYNEFDQNQFFKIYMDEEDAIVAAAELSLVKREEDENSAYYQTTAQNRYLVKTLSEAVKDIEETSYSAGRDQGYSNGYEDGESEGHNRGYSEGYETGEKEGSERGYREAEEKY